LWLEDARLAALCKAGIQAPFYAGGLGWRGAVLGGLGGREVWAYSMVVLEYEGHGGSEGEAAEESGKCEELHYEVVVMWDACLGCWCVIFICFVS